MRLIDADELEKVIKQDWFLDILLTQTSKYDMAKNLVDMIDSVPLAYDVDAVVEEIEEQKYKKPWDSDDIIINGHLDRAINAVRKGGVNENNN